MHHPLHMHNVCVLHFWPPCLPVVLYVYIYTIHGGSCNLQLPNTFIIRSSPYNAEDRSGVLVEVELALPVTPETSISSEDAEDVDELGAAAHTKTTHVMKVYIKLNLVTMYRSHYVLTATKRLFLF